MSVDKTSISAKTEEYTEGGKKNLVKCQCLYSRVEKKINILLIISMKQATREKNYLDQELTGTSIVV